MFLHFIQGENNLNLHLKCRIININLKIIVTQTKNQTKDCI